MEAISQETVDIIQDIASKVVMLESDDIQSLGEILKLVNELDEEPLQEYVQQVANIVERLILDEYESGEVGLEELNSAVEQLQIALQSEEQVSSEKQDEKRKIASDELDTEMLEADEADARIEFDEEDSPQDEAGQEKQGVSGDGRQKDEEESTEATDQEEQPGEEQSADDLESEIEEDDAFEEDDEKEKPSELLKERDEPDVINKTIQEDPELLQGFVDESSENLQMIETGLIQLESNPGDLSLIESIFRPFHTIKGVAGFLNLNDINALSHSYENLLDDVRKGKLEINNEVTDVIFDGIDALRIMLSKLADSQKAGEYQPHGLDLQYYAQIIENVQLGREMPDSKPEQAPSSEQKEEKEQSEPQQSEKSEAEQAGKESDSDSEETADSRQSQAVEPAHKPKPSPQKPSNKGKKVEASKASTALDSVESSVRVSTGKMDALLDLVGELVVTQNMVMQNQEIQESGDKRLQQDIGQLKRITTNLQDLSMSLRMVPIRDMFQKMHRIVRDLARKSNKKIVLELRGEDTEIDRNMVDELYEPLVHMIRNSCDHGLETPEERRAAGKSETGKITLNAHYKGGLVVIDVKDDGRGIRADKIRNRAIDRGLMDPEEKLTENQILNFIFSSGFTTREDVTNLSGRGVGMDVVRRVIERLRGNIEIKTELNKGTNFSLRLPLTLAIIDGVVVRVGNERYIIPTTGIKESLVAPEDSYNRIVGKGETVFIRNRVIPLLRIDKVFGIEGAVQDPNEGILIIVESDKQEAALLVDEMLDKQEIVIKSLGEGLNKINGLSGGAIMPDGSVGLILDIPTLLPKAKMSFKRG